MFGYKTELYLVQYIMAILDYVSADILKVRRKVACRIFPQALSASLDFYSDV